MRNFSRPGLPALALSLACFHANAQFKEIKAAPFSPATARTKIRTLLQATDETNRDRTVATLTEWVSWYRDILDDELVARWKSDGRTNLPLIMTPLADARVARELVQFAITDSTALSPEYAPMLSDLMARYTDSGKVFLDAFLPPANPNLTAPQAETVCRILLNMPDTGAWRRSAFLILPRYRPMVDRLLKQDAAGPDEEKMFRALRWRADLRLDPPAPVVSQKQNKRIPVPAPALSPTASDSFTNRPHIVGLPTPGVDYSGPMSGTFEWHGDPIPQNGECVFPNIPPVHLMLDFDTKRWEARLENADGQTQQLVMTNKGKGTQKKLVVHWSIVP